MKKKTINNVSNGPAVTACQFTGKSHLKKRMPCQDAFAFGQGHENLIVLTIADGVSSSPHSELAAQTAVKAVIEFWKDFHTFFPSDEVLHSALQACMNYALQKVDELSTTNPEPYAYETTLAIVLIQEGKRLSYIYVGDSGVYILSDKEEVLLLEQQMRHDDGSVYTLSSGPSQWVTGETPLIGIQAVLLVTDGVSDVIQNNGSDYLLAKQFMQKTDSNSEYQTICESALSQRCFQSMDDDATFLLYRLTDGTFVPSEFSADISENNAIHQKHPQINFSSDPVNTTMKHRARARRKTDLTDKQMPWNSNVEASDSTSESNAHSVLKSFMRGLLKKNKF